MVSAEVPPVSVYVSVKSTVGSVRLMTGLAVMPSGPPTQAEPFHAPGGVHVLQLGGLLAPLAHPQDEPFHASGGVHTLQLGGLLAPLEHTQAEPFHTPGAAHVLHAGGLLAPLGQPPTQAEPFHVCGGVH